MVVQVVRYSDSIDHSALRCQERLPTASCHVRQRPDKERVFAFALHFDKSLVCFDHSLDEMLRYIAYC